MKTRVAILTLTLAILCPSAENSPFYLPIRNNDLMALRKLIRAPGPKARDARGNSPLMYAAALGSLESMRLLLDAGGDPNAANDFAATPLMWCAGDAAKVRLLLSKGAQPDARSKLGRTPLLINSAYDGAIDAARALIEKGANVKARDEGGVSVLEQAANSNNIELVRLLLEKGADGNTADGGGYTALMGAAGNGDRNGPLVKLLIEHGAAVNAKTGDTAEIVKNGPIALGHLTALQMAAINSGMQRKEGDWPNYGVARPPLEDGGFTQTARGIRALRLYAIPGRQAEFDGRITRAVSWIEKAEPVTMEDRSMQILGVVWAGRKSSTNRIQQVVSRQRPDGGWGQTDHLPTDAYATGEALWALHESGMAPSDPVYRRGVDYLLRTQQADGTWHVVTRALGFQPYFQSGFPYEHDQWISQAGTSVATLALTFAAK